MKIDLDNIERFYQSSSPLATQVKRYILFQSIVWIFHLVVISLVSFFHLILNHGLGTIAEWINERGWELIIFTKVVVLFLFFQFFSLRFQVLSKIKSFYQNGFMRLRSDFLIVSVFFFIALFALGKPESNTAIGLEIGNLVLSYVGLIVFFGVDFLFLVLLSANFPLPQNDHFKAIVIHALTFFLGSWLSFQYEFINVNSIFFFIFLFLMYLSVWRRDNWTLPFTFLCFILTPISAFFGFDPVWQNQYSFLRFTQQIEPLEFNLIIVFCMLYLHLQQKRFPEYIYQE